MACSRTCSAENVFLFINIAFAMYSGALLSTAARLAWDPSTYSWLRFLCAAQYRACTGYLLAAGLWLCALVYLAACAARALPGRARAALLRLYVCGVAALAASEAAFGAWLAASLAAWWRAAPEAELARRGMDLLHDLKPALLAVERYRDVARAAIDMIEEVEREAPNNAYVIAVFALLGIVLQVTGAVLATRLARGAAREPAGAGDSCCEEKCAAVDDDSDASPPPPGAWRKHANLRMYTIIDKIF